MKQLLSAGAEASAVTIDIPEYGDLGYISYKKESLLEFAKRQGQQAWIDLIEKREKAKPDLAGKAAAPLLFSHSARASYDRLGSDATAVQQAEKTDKKGTTPKTTRSSE